MRGKYIPWDDGYGIVGYSYECPECGHETRFTDCEEGCENCCYCEEYVDPDELESAIEEAKEAIKTAALDF